MDRHYVNEYGRPTNERGEQLSAVLGTSSPDYQAFETRRHEFATAFVSSKTDADLLRVTRAMIAALEPLRDKLIDKGEIEAAEAELRELLDDIDEIENDPSSPKSEAYRRASAALAAAFVYEGTVEDRLEAARCGSAEFQEVLADVTDPDEQYQLRRRASSLTRHRHGLEAMLRNEAEPE